MTDAPSNAPDAPDTPENKGPDAPDAPQIRVITQYVKDLSFENPGAPNSLRANQTAPAIDMTIDVQAGNVENDVFEVVLEMSAKAARSEEDVVFIAELSFGGLFQIQNIDEAARQAFLLIECPRLLFPFARRILADATRDGGFPPLMLEPVDFAALYRQQMAKRAAAPHSGAEPNGDGDPQVN